MLLLLSVFTIAPFLYKQVLKIDQKSVEAAWQQVLSAGERLEENRTRFLDSIKAVVSIEAVQADIEGMPSPEGTSGTEGQKPQDDPSDAESGNMAETEHTEENTEPTESTSETENAAETPFTQVEPSYFDDALFIGDSRTVGLMEYGNLTGADYFCDSGMSVYNLYSKKIKVGDKGKLDFETLLSENPYGKIYVMLGINELGYDFDQTVERFGTLISELKEKQPEAVIIIQANLHIAKELSEKDDIYNNENINRFNEAIAGYADNENVYFIDVNSEFDDEEGNLNAEYTADDSHVLGKYYVDWCGWLCTKGVVKG